MPHLKPQLVSANDLCYRKDVELKRGRVAGENTWKEISCFHEHLWTHKNLKRKSTGKYY